MKIYKSDISKNNPTNFKREISIMTNSQLKGLFIYLTK